MYDALGFRFRLTCPDPASATYMAHILSGLEAAPSEGAVEFALRAAPAGAQAGPGPDEVGHVVGTVNLRAIGASAGSLLLHAGAVARQDGGVAVLCGPSGSGKSTLTATLSSRHAYVTDETVCLTPESLRITPFRKPLVLKQGAHKALSWLRPAEGTVPSPLEGDRWYLPPSSLTTASLPRQPLFPDVAIFPTYLPGEAVKVEEVAPAHAAYLFGTNSVQRESIRGGVLRCVARMARRAACFSLQYDDSERAADIIETLWADAA